MNSLSEHISKSIEEFDEEIKKAVEANGEIPENTCPSIDKIVKDLESYQSDIEYLKKNAFKYETGEELGKDLPDLGWENPIYDLDKKLRRDNEALRNLGQFWYEKCKEMKFFLRDSQIKLLEKVAELLASRDAYKMPYSDFDIDMELRNEEKTKKHIANQWYEKGMDDSFSSLQEIIKSEIEKIK